MRTRGTRQMTSFTQLARLRGAPALLAVLDGGRHPGQAVDAAEIDQAAPTEPPPLPPEPPEPVIPDAPPPPDDNFDQVKMAQYLNALSSYQNQVKDIQDSYKNQMNLYRAQSDVYQGEMTKYQEDLAVYNISRVSAVKALPENSPSYSPAGTNSAGTASRSTATSRNRSPSSAKPWAWR